jgi:hypothetical protein
MIIIKAKQFAPVSVDHKAPQFEYYPYLEPHHESTPLQDLFVFLEKTGKKLFI